MKWIKAYIGVRKSGPLFLNNRATRLNERSIYTICKKYFDLPPHDIRHAFATHLLANTNNPEAVKDILGHSDVKFTMKTYTHLAHSHIKQIYKGGMKRA
jgi:site-specific recombinase XerD